MGRAGRVELERQVQIIDREHPEWAASRIEEELGERAAVSYGDWKDDTPNRLARLRQIQRWRRGDAGQKPRRPEKPQFTLVWPVGERQRHAADPAYPAEPGPSQASLRLFLQNCSPNPLRELRARLAGVEVAYDPILAAGGFAELHWTRSAGIPKSLLAATDHERLQVDLEVNFASSDGSKAHRLAGTLTLDSTDGWMAFRGSDGTERSIG